MTGHRNSNAACTVDVAKASSKLVQVRAGRIPHGDTDQVDHAGLHDDLQEDRAHGVGQALEFITDDDEHIRYAHGSSDQSARSSRTSRTPRHRLRQSQQHVLVVDHGHAVSVSEELGLERQGTDVTTRRAPGGSAVDRAEGFLNRKTSPGPNSTCWQHPLQAVVDDQVQRLVHGAPHEVDLKGVAPRRVGQPLVMELALLPVHGQGRALRTPRASGRWHAC